MRGYKGWHLFIQITAKRVTMGSPWCPLPKTRASSTWPRCHGWTVGSTMTMMATTGRGGGHGLTVVTRPLAFLEKQNPNTNHP